VNTCDKEKVDVLMDKLNIFYPILDFGIPLFWQSPLREKEPKRGASCVLSQGAFVL